MATAAQQKALDAYSQALLDFENGGAPQYNVGSDLELSTLSPNDLEQLGASEYGNISTDPRLRDAQYAALSALEDRAKTGLSAQDEADMFKLQQDIARSNRGRMGAIQQNMASRGMAGSGMDIAAQLQASQDAGEREALAALEKGAQAQNAKLAAAQGAGQLGGQMQAQEFGQQAQKAAAADAVARFNAANRVNRQNENLGIQNAARQANWARGNQVGDMNTQGQYGYRRDLMGGRQDLANVQYGAATQDLNRKMWEKEQARQRRAALMGAAGTIGGAVIGSAMGPAGTVAGAQLGAQVGGSAGQAIGGYACGGVVSKDEKSVKGYATGGFVPYGPHETEADYLNENNPANDTKIIAATPGEVVLPKDVVKGGSPAVLDYMNRLEQSLASKKEDLAKAKEAEKMAGYGDIATDVANRLAQANNRGIFMESGDIKNLGKTPNIVRAETPVIESKLSPIAQRQTEMAQQALNQGRQEFAETEKTKQGLIAQDKAAMLDDPSSQQSRISAQMLQASILQKAKEAEMAKDPAAAAQLREAVKQFSPGNVSYNSANAQLNIIKGIDYRDALSNIAAQNRLNQQLASEEKRTTAANAKLDRADVRQKTQMQNDLRKEVMGNAQFKKHQEIEGSLSQMEALASQNSPTADNALIVMFQKGLDPGSVVRESEYARTAEAGGILDRLSGMKERIANGKLTPELRAQLLSAVKALRNGNLSVLQKYAEPYEKAIQQNDLDRSQIMPFSFESDTTKQKAASGPMTGADLP